MMQTKALTGKLNFENGGAGGPIICSGLWLSWVIRPLVPGKAGWQLVTSCARSAVADIVLDLEFRNPNPSHLTLWFRQHTEERLSWMLSHTSM